MAVSKQNGLTALIGRARRNAGLVGSPDQSDGETGGRAGESRRALDA